MLNVDPGQVIFTSAVVNRAKFVTERRRARNVTLANLWIKCLQSGNNLSLKAKAAQQQHGASAI